MSATQTLEEPPQTGQRGPIKHIRRPDNPNVAWCGATKTRPERYFFHEATLSEICSMCLSYPGALEYAKNPTRDST